MADDEFVIGFSDSEWTGIAPLLEEDVAISSLAQDELGHAAALYGLLAELDRAATPTRSPTTASPPTYRHARLLDHGRGDWAMTIARRYLYETADAVRLEALATASWAPLAELVGKLVREERYHPMHIAAWLDRLARAAASRATAARRARRRSGPMPATVFTPLPDEPALVEAGSCRADGRARGALARRDRADVRAPRPAAAAARRAIRLAAATRPRRAVPLAVGRVHARSGAAIRERRGERGATHVAIAGPAGPSPTAALDVATVRAALAEVPDPEIPVCPSSTSGSSHASTSARTRSASSSCRRSSAARRSTSSARRSSTGSSAFGRRSRSRHVRRAVDVGPDHAARVVRALAAAGIAPPAAPGGRRAARCCASAQAS